MLSRSATKVIIQGLCYSLLVLGLVSGCRTRPELDTSLLTGDPCAPPCWHNITPGVSDEDNVRSQLENSPFVKKSTLHYTLTEEAGIPLVRFSWQAPGRDYIYLQNGRVWQMERYNYIYLREGKVLRIEISLHGRVRLGEIVDKYGPPESIYASVGAAEFYWYTITFNYPAIGLTLESFSLINPGDVADGTILVSEEMRITQAYYYTPTSLQKMLSEVLLLPPDRIEYFFANRQRWEGFGRYRLAGQ